MTIASGQPASAADVLAGVNSAESSAVDAQSAANAAATLAAAADAHASTAVAAANTATAAAAVATAQTGGLHQQITNVATGRTTNVTAIDQHTADIGALANRLAALEGTGPPAVPNPPTNPTSTGVTPTSVSLSATAPASGPAPTGYKWEYKRNIDPTFLLSSVATLTGTQSGLASSTAYDFRVSAVNAAGPSAPSGVYTVSTGTAPTLVESAHATTLTTTSGTIVDAALNVWTLITATAGVGDFQIAINGVRQTDTNDVTLMKYYNPVGAAVAGTTKHSVAHQNTLGDWYISTGVVGNIATFAQLSGDPFATVVTPPPPSGNAPGPAVSAGFLVQTFGPGLTIGARGTAGANWYPTVPSSGSVQQLANNKVFIRGGSSGYNYEMVTAEPGAGMNGVGNRSFGGGGYFEALVSMEDPGFTAGPVGWPGWWANDMEGQIDNHGPLGHWPGQPPGYGMWFEPDNAEFLGPSNKHYGVQIHNWYGLTNDVNHDYTLPSPPINVADISVPNYYGWLWVPATPTTQGKVSWWINRVEQYVFMYNYFDRNNPSPPPPTAQNACGGMDTTPNDDGRHFQLILGTGDNNSFTVHEVSVWQKDGSKNLFTGINTTTTPPPPSAGGPGSGPAFQDLASGFQDMGNGQRCSTGISSVTFQNFRTGVYTLQIKPFTWNGIWRNGDTGNYLSPLIAAFVDRGRYLYLPDTPKVFSANGCPPLNPANNHVTGFPAFVQWWTAGNISAPISWGLFYEPGFDSGDGQVYSVINDYSAARGDTFHVTANMAGRGVCRATSWGSILDFTAEASGTPGYGLGWIAFIGYNMTMDQIISNW